MPPIQHMPVLIPNRNNYLSNGNVFYNPDTTTTRSFVDTLNPEQLQLVENARKLLDKTIKERRKCYTKYISLFVNDTSSIASLTFRNKYQALLERYDLKNQELDDRIIRELKKNRIKGFELTKFEALAKFEKANNDYEVATRFYDGVMSSTRYRTGEEIRNELSSNELVRAGEYLAKNSGYIAAGILSLLSLTILRKRIGSTVRALYDYATSSGQSEDLTKELDSYIESQGGIDNALKNIIKEVKNPAGRSDSKKMLLLCVASAGPKSIMKIEDALCEILSDQNQDHIFVDTISSYLMKKYNIETLNEGFLKAIADNFNKRCRDKSYECPIGLHIFNKPVNIKGQPANHVFEKENIETWWQNKNTNPLINTPTTAETKECSGDFLTGLSTFKEIIDKSPQLLERLYKVNKELAEDFLQNANEIISANFAEDEEKRELLLSELKEVATTRDTTIEIPDPAASSDSAEPLGSAKYKYL